MVLVMINFIYLKMWLHRYFWWLWHCFDVCLFDDGVNSCIYHCQSFSFGFTGEANNLLSVRSWREIQKTQEIKKR